MAATVHSLVWHCYNFIKAYFDTYITYAELIVTFRMKAKEEGKIICKLSSHLNKHVNVFIFVHSNMTISWRLRVWEWNLL